MSDGDAEFLGRLRAFLEDQPAAMETAQRAGRVEQATATLMWLQEEHADGSLIDRAIHECEMAVAHLLEMRPE